MPEWVPPHTVYTLSALVAKPLEGVGSSYGYSSIHNSTRSERGHRLSYHESRGGTHLGVKRGGGNEDGGVAVAREAKLHSGHLPVGLVKKSAEKHLCSKFSNNFEFLYTAIWI